MMIAGDQAQSQVEQSPVRLTEENLGVGTGVPVRQARYSLLEGSCQSNKSFSPRDINVVDGTWHDVLTRGSG